MNHRFLEIDHSGDVGVEAWGADTRELLENVTRGLLGLMATGRVAPKIERTIKVHSHSTEDLVVDWLAEVILAASTFGEVYGAVEVRDADERAASGVVRGEPVNAVRKRLRFDVKAATYHGLVVDRCRDGWHARVVFDL